MIDYWLNTTPEKEAISFYTGKERMPLTDNNFTVSLVMELKEAQAMEQRINDREFANVENIRLCISKKRTALLLRGTRDG